MQFRCAVILAFASASVAQDSTSTMSEGGNGDINVGDGQCQGNSGGTCTPGGQISIQVSGGVTQSFSFGPDGATSTQFGSMTTRSAASGNGDSDSDSESSSAPISGSTSPSTGGAPAPMATAAGLAGAGGAALAMLLI